MDIIFLFYGLAFLVMGLVIIILRNNESSLKLTDILWLLAAFGFTHGLLEWTDLWRIVRGDNAGLAATRPAILLISYLFLFEFGRRLVLMSLSADTRVKPAGKLLGTWLYAPLLGLIIVGTAISDQPVLTMTIGSRYFAGFFGSSLAGVGFILYWRNHIKSTSLNHRMTRIGSQVAGGAFIAYAILGGLVVPRADWFPASVINQETFLEIFHVPVQLLRAICAMSAAVSIWGLLRVFHLEALQRFSANEDRLHLATTAGNIGIWDWDIVNNELIFDDSMYALYGIHKEEFGGAYDAWSRMLHPDDCKFTEEEVQAALRGEREYTANFRILHQDGTIRHIKASSKTFRDPHGTPIRMIGTNVDITELKQAEEQLRLFNETLEQQVIEQTRQNIEQERLLIEQSRRAVMGEMIRNIAHQWRQPLNTVGLVVQNISDDFRGNRLTEEGLDKDVDTAMRCVKNMSTTIDDFRNFFRPDKTKSLFKLKLAIDESLSLIEATLKNNAIKVSLSGNLELQAFGQINEFSQVILNLLTNAKDALIDNKVPYGKIEIELGSTGHAGIIVIRDNAGGIPEEAMEKIFEPYFTTKISGSGVGLYMSKIIIEKHMSGSITFRNMKDGAEFTVGIPLMPSDEMKLE